MPEQEDHPLAWLEQAAPHVPKEHRERYAEIYGILANGSGLLHSAEQSREYNRAVTSARQDLVPILQEMASSHPDDSVIAALLAYYVPRSTDNDDA